MRNHRCNEWSKVLPEAILAMNSQQHSVTLKGLYEIVFGQGIFGNGLLFTERLTAVVEEEAGEEQSIPIDPQLLLAPLPVGNEAGLSNIESPSQGICFTLRLEHQHPRPKRQ